MLRTLTRGTIGLLQRPETPIFLVALTLAILWFGPAGALLVALAGLPGLVGVARSGWRPGTRPEAGPERLIAALDAALDADPPRAAALVLGPDAVDDLRALYGADSITEISRRIAGRLTGHLRSHDIVSELGDGRVGVVLNDLRRNDLEEVMQITARLRELAETPMTIRRTQIGLSISAGFCLVRTTGAGTGAECLVSALAALTEAQAAGPGTIRAHTHASPRAESDRDRLRGVLAAALENGEIVPLFTPQIDSNTGAVSGFTLAPGWQHPERSVMSPTEIEEAFRAAGMSARLLECLVTQGCAALRAWDRSGYALRSITIPLDAEAAVSPILAQRLRWELDRHDLTPQRLVLLLPPPQGRLVTPFRPAHGGPELDTATTQVQQAARSLSAIGCLIEQTLGAESALPVTPHQAADRLRLPAEATADLETDADQRRNLSILTEHAAERGQEVVATGVASHAAHSLLAQLGVAHAEGPAIAGPLPFVPCGEWLLRHGAKLAIPRRPAPPPTGAARA